MPMTLILYFMFQEKDFKVISWISIKYCEFSTFFKIKLSIFTFYGNQMNRISLKEFTSLSTKCRTEWFILVINYHIKQTHSTVAFSSYFFLSLND